MTSFQNAFLTVRNELLSQGYTPDAGSICFNKPLGGRSMHSVIVPGEDMLDAERIVSGLDSFAESSRNPEFYRAVTFVFLDFDGRFDRDGGLFRALSDSYMKLAGQGTVCDFIILNMENGESYRIGSGKAIDRALAGSLAKAAAAYAAGNTNTVYSSRDGSDHLGDTGVLPDETTYRGTAYPYEQTAGTLKDYGNRNMIVVYIIIGLCAAAFVWGLYTEFTLGYDLPKTLGIQNNELIAKGQWWRLITPMFLHADAGHLLGNMLSLFYLGRVVTRNHTKLEFLTVYFLSGLAGNVLSFFFLGRNTLSLGASGAIMGVGGMLIYMFTFSRNKQYFRRYGNYISLIAMVAFNLLYGLFIAGGSINNFAHFGGFVTGFVIALLFELSERKKTR
ncbi:MAG: rhomboid family intramembrane serine protease [Clostridia bacterium]|nr:rhomboid family intramembrane serine protease [Clostridia bacterium]